MQRVVNILINMLKSRGYRNAILKGVIFGGGNKLVEFKLFQYRVKFPFRSFRNQFKSIYLEKAYYVPFKGSPKILDLGANHGMTCIYFKTLFPDSEIVAFEADPQIFANLKANLDRNDIKATLHNKAAWIKDDTMEFSANGLGGGTLSEYNKEDRAKVQVECVDIKPYLEGVDILKMDIEGAENALLPHIMESIKDVKYLIFEYHAIKGKDNKLGMILSSLEKMFKIHIRTEDGNHNPYVTEVGGNFDNQLVIYSKNLNLN